jgi:hypothetical protein
MNAKAIHSKWRTCLQNCQRKLPSKNLNHGATNSDARLNFNFKVQQTSAIVLRAKCSSDSTMQPISSQLLASEILQWQHPDLVGGGGTLLGGSLSPWIEQHKWVIKLWILHALTKKHLVSYVQTRKHQQKNEARYLLWSCSWNGEERVASTSSSQFQWSCAWWPSHSSYLNSGNHYYETLNSYNS